MRKRFYCLGLSVLMAVTCLVAPLSASAASASGSNGSTDLNSKTKKIVDSYDQNSESNSYYDYYNHFSSKKSYSGFIDVKATKYAKIEHAKTGTYDKKKAVILDDGNKWVEYKVTVPESAKYGISIDYYQLPYKEKDIELTVYVDGKLPYTEAQQISVPRIWEDSIDKKKVPEGGYFECANKDGLADDTRPSQKEKQIWTTRDLINVQGLYTEPYQFYLTKGTHTLRFKLEREALAISDIHVGNEKAAISYSDYIAQYSDADYVKNEGNNDLSIIRQAEQTFSKNNIIIYPTYDKSGASTQPNDPAYTKLNTIGQSNWSTNGDEIVWSVNAQKAGLYRLVMRARQNFNAGLYSYRTLKINGKVPFAEANEIRFKYQQGWYMLTLGNGETGDKQQDYYVYLNEGENKFSLACTTGEMSQVLRNIQQSVLDLNEIYRQIIAVTSADPDSYRDYTLDQQIPTLTDDLKAAYDFLNDTAKIVKGITGTDGSQAASVNYVTGIIKDFYEDPYIIPQRLTTFKNGIETLGSLITSIGKLALELDYIAFLPKNAETPAVGNGFLNAVSFTWKQFISSFTVDYNMTSTDDGTATENADVVKVWVSTGRDQAKIINRLISDNSEKLVTKSGKKVAVQLSMVDTGATLIRATLAGKGPDCALMIGEDTPMNLAARGALIPLTSYKKNLEGQFYSCAWIPFYYNGEYYALPETQSFDLMFYRTDVFRELGIKAPKTWDEFYRVMEVLQNSNLKVGIPEVNSANAGVSSGITTFDRFLIQNGGTYYTKKLDKTLFDQEVAYSAFEQWVELYSKYGLDRSFDFYSRFRTGEMPLSIQNYASYNQIKSAAPELNGLWTIAPIPGTVQKNGSINNSETSVVTGCIMLKSAQKKGIEEAASTFLSWWVDSETQAEYARELEATLGVAARYAPANKLAFETLGWTAEESAVIKSQWKSVTVMNEIPGNYVLKRSLTSAFRAVIAGKNSARRSLTIYNKDINDEIKRKRKEFGLE